MLLSMSTKHQKLSPALPFEAPHGVLRFREDTIPLKDFTGFPNLQKTTLFWQIDLMKIKPQN